MDDDYDLAGRAPRARSRAESARERLRRHENGEPDPGRARAVARARKADFMVRRGWDPDVIAYDDAVSHLRRLADLRVDLRCECGKRLGELWPMPFDGDWTLRDGGASTWAGPHAAPWLRRQYCCPLTKCGRLHVVRSDRLTAEFIGVAGTPKAAVTLPLRDPRKSPIRRPPRATR